MSTQVKPALAAARFAARPRRGVLLGFSGPRLAMLASAVLAATIGLYVAGLGGLLLVSPAIVVLLASALILLAGRTAVEWLPVAGHWALRRVLGQDWYAARVFTPRRAGSFALPGDASALRVHVDVSSGAAMIHDPHRHTLTVTCLVSHPSFVLLGSDDQARRVIGWGRVLASLARTGHVAAIQVLEATVPDDGTKVRDWWTRHGRHDDSWPSRTYGEFIAAAAPTAARHRTTVSLSLDMRRAGRVIHRAGRGVAGAAAVLRGDMAALETALRAADLSPQRWLGEAELAQVVRAAYDPDGASLLDAAGRQHRASSAGPVGVREHWGWLESDRSVSAVLWISEWPRSDAFPNFLHPLVLAPGVRRSLSLVVKPVPVAEARREIRRQKANYVSDADQKARIGQIADVTDTQEYQDVLQREQQIALGHADLRFAAMVAVTTASKDDLDAAVAVIEQAAIQCECETRLLVGQQSQAFAGAALPLGRGL